jgi:hypothetical protein
LEASQTAPIHGLLFCPPKESKLLGVEQLFMLTSLRPSINLDAKLLQKSHPCHQKPLILAKVPPTQFLNTMLL